MLKKLRIIIATLVFVAFIVLFLGIRFFPDIAWLSFISEIQLAPAIASFNVVALVILCVVTLLFGRIYCSVLCPLGIFQDMASRLKPRKKKPYRYWRDGRAMRVVKLGIALTWLASFILGIGAIWGALDPYAIFSRMLAHNIAPGFDKLMGATGAVPDVALWSQGLGIASIAFAAVSIIAIAVVAFFTGRGYCTTVCPVGTILGYIGKYSLFVIRIDAQKCRHCKCCERRCKSHCLDVAKRTDEEAAPKDMVDRSRCIACMNCLESCKFGALRYGLRAKVKEITPEKDCIKDCIIIDSRSTDENEKGREDCKDGTGCNAIDPPIPALENANHPIKKGTETASLDGDIDKGIDDEKRVAFKTIVAGAVVMGASLYANAGFAAPSKKRSNKGKISRKDLTPREHAVFPPSSDSVRDLIKRCTGCGLCARICPNHVIYFPMTANVHVLQPRMRFDYGACRPSCNACTRVCPTGALRELAPSEKANHRIGRAVVDRSLCVNYTTPSTQCRACERMCPYGAIAHTESTRANGKPCMIPTVDPNKCVGCGTCEYVCAARPIAAIHVEGEAAHQRSQVQSV